MFAQQGVRSVMFRFPFIATQVIYLGSIYQSLLRVCSLSQEKPKLHCIKLFKLHQGHFISLLLCCD